MAAASAFADSTGNEAVIGSLADIDRILSARPWRSAPRTPPRHDAGTSDDPATEVSDGSLDRLIAVDEPSNTSVTTRCCDGQLNPPWLPRSEWQTVPAGQRSVMALRIAETASADFMCSAME